MIMLMMIVMCACSWYSRISVLKRAVIATTLTTTCVQSVSVRWPVTNTSRWPDDHTAPRATTPSTPTTAAPADESSPSNSVTWYTQTGSGTTSVSGVQPATDSWSDTLAYWSPTDECSATARTAPISDDENYFRSTTAGTRV